MKPKTRHQGPDFQHYMHFRGFYPGLALVWFCGVKACYSSWSTVDGLLEYALWYSFI